MLFSRDSGSYLALVQPPAHPPDNLHFEELSVSIELDLKKMENTVIKSCDFDPIAWL